MSARLNLRAALATITALALTACDQTDPPVAAPNAAAPRTLPAGPVGSPPSRPTTPRPVEAAARPEGSTVENPDDRTVALIYYSLSGGSPPETWAAEEAKSGATNEFDRQTRTTALRQELTSQMAQASQVGRLKISVRSDISQYDVQRGVYYVGLFGGSTSLGFAYHGQNYRLEFTNKDKAQAWRLPADEAQRVLELNDGGRSVVVTVTVELLSAYAKADGGAIRARVLNYAIENPSTNALLGRADVPQT